MSLFISDDDNKTNGSHLPVWDEKCEADPEG